MGPGITYYGVNAHFQNGPAEKAIRYLQTISQHMILHAKGRWTKSINLSLWTYVFRIAIHLHKNVPNAADASSRLEAFLRIDVSPKSSHYHNFGCSAFTLITEADQGEIQEVGKFVQS